MAKALYGTVAPTTQFQLLDEIRALRSRVAELEAALEAARVDLDERHDVGAADLEVVVDPEPATISA